MNLEQLRKQAKELVRAARDGDVDALARLGHLPVRLASAQLVLAREHGHAGWPALVHALETTVESFVAAATSGRGDRARRLLAARPQIAADPWTGLVLGTGWSGDASAPGGPLGWAPLLYVAHSCFAPTQLARDLLARGADPNATFANEHGEPGPDAQETLILAALRGRLETIVAALGPDFFGHVGGGPPGALLHHACWVGDPQVVARLLELGADPVRPSDGDSGTPIAWAAHGSQWHRTPGRDYVAVAERLLTAGAQLEPRLLDVAEGPLAEWLDERMEAQDRRS